MTRLKSINAAISIPPDVINSLWYSFAEVLAEIFVEGCVMKKIDLKNF